MSLVEVYKITPEWGQVTLKLGNWNERRNKRLEVTDQVIWERRKDMQGMAFVAVAIEKNPPFVYVSTNKDTKKDKFHGIFIDVWNKVLATAMNFSTIITADATLGYKYVQEMVIDGKADVGLADVTITLDRSIRMDFSPPLMKEISRIFINANISKGNWAIYVNSFTFYLWLGLLSIIVVLIFLLITTFKLGANQVHF